MLPNSMSGSNRSVQYCLLCGGLHGGTMNNMIVTETAKD
jgi:hypothetical protein